jgi:RimJ/RimL family protein N-acetyltransferase
VSCRVVAAAIDGPDEEACAMEIVGLRGERVRLVPSDRTLHLENAYRWLNDPEITATLAVHHGVTRRMEEDFFDRIECDRTTDLHWAIHDESDCHIGFTSLHGLGGWNRTATGGLFLGERSAWGRGYATDAVRVRNRFGFEEVGLHRIEGHTINPAMARVYEKCGYSREGSARQKLWRSGRWHDAALYAILDVDHFRPASSG